MPLISLTGAYLAFSDAPLLDNTDLFIDENERVCLVGRNGAGKSTLLRVLAKEQPLDDGQVVYEQDLVTARLQQDPPEISKALFLILSRKALQKMRNILPNIIVFQR
ncbi:ABC transporter ATPase component [Proteus mirabilis]|nr:ABC transporter ATPase component [Proteus mirabilis]